MEERVGVITMMGKPLTLVGPEVRIGVLAPDFEVVDNDLNPFRFFSMQGKVCIICSVPSLDTKTCDLETRRFKAEAANLTPDIALVAPRAWGANLLTNLLALRIN